jgi:hypothetical protein
MNTELHLPRFDALLLEREGVRSGVKRAVLSMSMLFTYGPMRR